MLGGDHGNYLAVLVIKLLFIRSEGRRGVVSKLVNTAIHRNFYPVSLPCLVVFS